MQYSLTALTLAEARDAIHAGELSPVDLTEACLARIESVNPSLNAFLEVTADTALAQARAATEAVDRGGAKLLSSLHGIPLALKDLYNMQGVRTTAGSKLFKDNLAAEDAYVTGRLRAAGAVLLGKLNMHEWAYGVTTVNPHFGPCRNPWDTARITGGSSGGSGAALAAGLCLGALGSDTGGSIRIPASLCGVVGLKPTYGRVSLRGAVPLAWSLDHAGPMARTVRDAAILLQAIAGYDREDPVSAGGPPGETEFELALDMGVAAPGARPFIVGVPDESVVSDLHPETDRAIREAIATIGDLGCQVRQVTLPGYAQASEAAGRMLGAEASAFHRDRLNEAPEAIGADVLARLRWGLEVTGTDYALARRAQAEWRRQLSHLFETIDLLVLPATPVPAPLIADSDGIKLATGVLTRFTRAFNLSGNPALVLPCGFTACEPRLPIGLQIVGPAWQESQVLRLAHAYEQAAGFHKHVAPV